MDPIILFFILGVVLGTSKSEVRLPSQIYDFISPKKYDLRIKASLNR